MSLHVATSTLRGRLIAPYQHEGVRWMLSRETATGVKGGILSDEMGLGKTVQVIATILGNPGQKTLIIVPKSIVNQWKQEIEHFAPSLTVHAFDGPRRALVPSSVTIAPYSVLIEKNSRLHQEVWGRIVLDEGHQIRNTRSKIFKSCCDLTSPIRWILSGTPVYNSIRDFVALCAFIGISQSAVQGFSTQIRDTYVLRRTKEEGNGGSALNNSRLQLPPCDFQNIELDMFPEELELYKRVFTSSRDRVRQIMARADAGQMFMNILECFLRVRQVLIHPQLYLNGVARQGGYEPDRWTHRTHKMTTLFEMILEHPREKTLVFCQFTEEINFIQKRLEDMGQLVFRIDGSVEQETRILMIAEFKKAASGVFVIQVKSGGQGLNLQEATRVYITSPSWNPATELQAIGRSHRTGQTQKVTVRKLVYKGSPDLPSIEESIMELQRHKAVITAQVLNDPRLATQIPVGSNSMTTKDLKRIFEIDDGARGTKRKVGPTQEEETTPRRPFVELEDP